MREKLVCYLLGELEDAERVALEVRLANEPALRKELEQIRACLDAHEAEPDCCCPEGLAARTADCITRLSHDGVDSPCGRSRWSFADLVVAGGVLLAVGAMLLPALPAGREVSRRVQCDNNMRQIGQALQRYEEKHGYFPELQPHENAGMFAVRLAESGAMSRPELSKLLWCRASQLQDRNAKLVVVAPNPEQLEKAKGQALALLQRWMAGSYAYRLGYYKDGKYHQVRNRCSSSVSPILSDAPTYLASGWVSLSHGQEGGKNVLHMDGHVRFEVGRGCPSMDSDLFANRQGRAAAGLDECDVVVVRSDQIPGPPPGSHSAEAMAPLRSSSFEME